MDRLKKPKDFLEKLRLTNSDYQDSGMINHIADLLERYSTEQLILHGVVGQSEQLADDKSYQPCDGCNTSCKEWEIFFCKKLG